MKLEALCARARNHRKRTGRPLVTISYAQSLDGSITTRRGVPLSLSGRESLRLWHRLRVYHDAILVGIGTVLADDPQLNVRLVPGSDPQPVILDTKLRFPLKALAMNSGKPPWIITVKKPNATRREILKSHGAQVICLNKDRSGRIDLHCVLDFLAQMKMNSVMIEGGARVITSFLEEKLVDYFVITITPYFVGGLHAVEKLMPLAGKGKIVRLNRTKIMGHKQYGRDLVIWGKLR